MVTRRTLLKQGAYAALSAATTTVLTGRVSAQSASPGGFDFYISPTGSDSNPGTHDHPWAITAINTRRGDYAGKRVGLLDGIYNVHALCEAAPQQSGVALAVNGGPSVSSPTVIAAVNARKALLTGADPATGAYPSKAAGIIGQGYLQVPNKGNVILDGLSVTRSWGKGIFFYPQLPTPEGGTTGIVVRNSDIYDIGGDIPYNPGGIWLRCCKGALIHNNRIHSTAHAAILTFLCHSNIYEYNTIYDCDMEGIYDKNPENGNHTYRFNYVECAGRAIKDCSGGDAGEVVTVHNNIFVAPTVWDGTDIRVPSTQSLVFYNNTCYNGVIFYPAGGSSISPPATVKFYNNIVYVEKAGWSGAIRFCAGTVALSNYNVYRVAAGLHDLIGVSPVSAPRSIPKLLPLSEWQKTTKLDSDSLETTVASDAMFSTTNKQNPKDYALQDSAAGRRLGRVGGVASGAVTDVGAWGGGATQIGCDFGRTPRAPELGIK